MRVRVCVCVCVARGASDAAAQGCSTGLCTPHLTLLPPQPCHEAPTTTHSPGRTASLLPPSPPLQVGDNLPGLCSAPCTARTVDTTCSARTACTEQGSHNCLMQASPACPPMPLPHSPPPCAPASQPAPPWSRLTACCASPACTCCSRGRARKGALRGAS